MMWLARLLRQEVVETVVMVRQIIDYHVSQLREGRATRRRKAEIKEKMGQAKSYPEWEALANEYDGLKDIQIWKENMHSEYYDYQYIKFMRDELRQARIDRNVRRLVRLMRSNPSRNPCNILNPLLYRQCFVGTKSLIQNYHEEVRLCIQLILSAPEEVFSRTKKLQFFVQTRHAVGRTALLLSGGASLGMYHTGVINCLARQGLLPRVVAGSSAGSIFASFLAVKGPEVFVSMQMNLDAFQQRRQSSFFRQLKRFLASGNLMDITVLQQFLRDNLGDVTFQEAYDHTGIILNITVTGGQANSEDRMLNYLTAPNVLIWSASAASCSIPLIYGASQLYCKNQAGEIQTFATLQRKFLDGSIGADLPMQKLSVMFNVNSFIVSQTNPWVVPFRDTQTFAHTTGKISLMVLQFLEMAKELYLSEVKHRAEQLKRLGLVPTFLQKYINLITQSYRGDVTIWPIPRVSDYIRLLRNPTSPDDVVRYFEGGMKRTFQKIGYIKNLTFLQRLLEQGHRALKTRTSNSQLFEEDLSDRDFQRNASFVFPNRQQSLVNLRIPQ